MASFVRQTAVPCTVKDIKEGKFVQRDDSPSGVETERGFLSRTNIYAFLTGKDEVACTIDDGTGQLKVRAFDAHTFPEIGRLCLVIGRPREYNGERYLALEIIKPINQAWIALRKRELESLEPAIVQEQSPPAEPKKVEVPDDGKNPFEQIVEEIRRLDTGQGAPKDELLTLIAHPDKEQLVQTLIEEGEIFEIRPGMVKVLE